MRPHRSLLLLALFAWLTLALGSACDSSSPAGPPANGGDPTDPVDPVDPGEPDPDPVLGQSDFLSADGQPGDDASDDDRSAAPDDGAAGGERSVEEGDIYRVLGNQRILNLNAYRGLQVIDFSDTTAPTIIGRYSITGGPVELYTYQDRVIVLMNNWQGYYGSRFSTLLEGVTGGVVAVIDIADPTRPALLSQSYIPGYIQRSRLVHGGGQAALYVAASEWGQFEDAETGELTWGQRTYVKSFDVSGPVIEDRTEIALGGYVTDIQATPNALMVARGTNTWWERGDGSTVTLIDIGNPDGTMVRGDEIQVRGRVHSQFNMDLYNGVLRVVSGNRWGGGQGNWVQTFDASDFSRLSLIDEKTFGNPNEDLFATLFLGNKAFFVTYFRVDPFHAFEITDEGIATERTEFIVSGWNDFFRAVNGTTRLIGIGMNDDEGGSARAAVSLYDITDLDNPEPLMARAEVSTARWTWSEANWDHRAFSVLENAVSVLNEDGELETGLVLLPFSGWDENSYRSAVQIFTFSENSLTQRGTMEHPDPVRRTFLPEPATATNFSETEMRFHDVADPDLPIQLGAVELAPNYSDVWVFGEVSARYRNPNTYWWYGQSGENPDGAIEFFRTSEDPDIAVPFATVVVPGRADVVRTGDGLTVLTVADSGDSEIPQVLVQTVDFTDPAAPALRPGRVLPLPGYWGGRGGYHYYDWYPWYWGGPVEMDFAQDVLVHRESVQQQRELGPEEYCYYHQRDYRQDCWDADREEDGEEEREEERDCTILQGYRSCHTDYRGRQTCHGSFERCTYLLPQWELVSCEPLTEEEIAQHFRRECHTYVAHRYWQSWTLHRIDLSDPAEPRLLAPLATDVSSEMQGADVFDGVYHLNWSVPVEVDDDARGYVRWFFREVDLRAADEAAAFGPAVNLPGRLVQREGNALFTQDQLYGENIVESTINRLELIEDRAYLRGTERFRDAWVRNIVLDGAGLVFVNHQPWQMFYWGRDGVATADVATSDGEEREESEEDRNLSRLSVYRIEDDGFAATANVPIDSWAELRTATPARAIFNASGGVLVVNVEDPSDPHPQTFVGLRGWPSRFVAVGQRLWIPSNRFGIQEVDAEEGNLLLVD
jgi:hypothetical protein